MALSKPIPDSIQDVPEIGQHYVECDTEGCNKNCQFYCNPCYRSMCEQCRNEHLRSEDTKTHEVVLYRQRIRQLPVEKCKDHPTKDIDMLCEECQVSLCSKCATRNHRGHVLTDLEEIYSERFTQCLGEIYKIHRYFLPTTQEIQEDIKENATEVKMILEDLRTSMKAEAETLKNLVDEVVSMNLEQVNKIEDTLVKMLESQNNTYREYITYLNDLVKEFNGYLSFSESESRKLLSITERMLEIQPIPLTTKLVLPVFTKGQHNLDDVTNLLGRVNIPAIKPETRTFKPMEIESTKVKSTEKQTKQDREKTLSLSSTVTMVTEYKVPGVENVCHVSLGKSGRIWVSDKYGNLVQTDLHGNLLQNMVTCGTSEGYHTYMQKGDLMYASKNDRVINKVTIDGTVTEFIKTGDWKPVSIHSSHINGDILVGMKMDGKAKITRYSKTGKEIQNIQEDNKGLQLYGYPHYITENTEGDICTSDYGHKSVVVTDKSGQPTFSYKGQGRKFNPYGICTDLLNQILVCDYLYDTIELLNKDGKFLCFVLTKQQRVVSPCSVCVDDENNLHLGQRNSNTVIVYKYLQ